MLQEQRITSFSPQACLYRWKMRPFVELLFDKRFVIYEDGRKRSPTRKEKIKYDQEARELWRTIIMDSNKL